MHCCGTSFRFVQTGSERRSWEKRRLRGRLLSCSTVASNTAVSGVASSVGWWNVPRYSFQNAGIPKILHVFLDSISRSNAS